MTAMTARQIQDAIDGGLEAQWAEILRRQAEYRSAHGRYFQGLPTHTEVPADGAEVAPDRLGAHPTDQAEDWQAMGWPTAGAGKSLARIDTYDGPQGTGFALTLRVRIGPDVWGRAVQEGPENWRAHDWRKETVTTHGA